MGTGIILPADAVAALMNVWVRGQRQETAACRHPEKYKLAKRIWWKWVMVRTNRGNGCRGAKPSEYRTRARVDVNTWICVARTDRQGVSSRLSLCSTAPLHGSALHERGMGWG